MNFLKENKAAIFLTAAAATVGGLVWYSQGPKGSLEDRFIEIYQNYTSKKQKDSTSGEIQKGSIQNVLLDLSKQFIQRGSRKEEKNEQIQSFFLQGFQMFFQGIKELETEQQMNLEILALHQSFIGALLQIFGKDDNDCFEALKQFILSAFVEEKIDVFDFIFSSLHFINQQDLELFLKEKIFQDQQLRFLFLHKLVKNAHTCLKISEESLKESSAEESKTEDAEKQKKLANSDFFFSNEIIDLTQEVEFLKTLDVEAVQSSVTYFAHFATSFNKSIDLFTLKEPFLVKWQKLLRNIVGSQEYIAHALQMKSPNLLAELFKQLVYSLFIFTVSYNLEDKEVEQYQELYSMKLMPYCSIMILAEEGLKTLNAFLTSVKKCGMLFKYKTAFVTILHDFMITLVSFYQQNNCSNFHNVFIQAITLLITHFQTSIPSSSSIALFWKQDDLPTDCDIKNLSEPYFRMNLAPFFEITGMLKLVEQLQTLYEDEPQKKIKSFMQMMNNKQTIYNRLKVLGYQYSVLQEDFERQDVQQTIIKHLFKSEDQEFRSVIFKLLFFCEKIITPLHLFNQISEEGLPNEDKEIIAEQLNNYTNVQLQYLINVFKLANQELPIQEALIYVRNGIHSSISLAQLSQHLDPSNLQTCVLKKDAPLTNITELYFDRQMSFEGFQKADLNQDLTQPLYCSVDFISEIQYRIFTKPFFQDFAENCVFKNSEVLGQLLPHALILYEVILDFVFKANLEAKLSSTKLDNPTQSLLNRILSNKSVYSAMKAQEELFVKNHPNSKELNAGLFKRIEKRLNMLANP